MDRNQYEENLRQRQQAHLDAIRRNDDINWQPCLHDGCASCHGTGIKIGGAPCIHALSCSCPKCSPRM